ncbi:Phage endonuclease I [compost metagenome]
MNEKIVCLICGKQFIQITENHLKKHNITMKMYREKFPNCDLVSRSLREKLSLKSKGKEKSEEHKKALKEAKANENKEHRAKVNGDNRRGKPMTKEAIEKIARNSKPRNFKTGIRQDIGHFVRSTWEANYVRILKFKKINYQFEPQIFWLIAPDGRQISYTPDFYLIEKDMYIEVKGFWYEDARQKFDLFREQYPDIKIDVVDTKVYNVLEKQFKPLIKEWE